MLRVRSLDCQTLNIHLDLIGYGESPAVRGEDHVMPRAEGREVGTRRKDVYRFVLEGYVEGTGADPDARALSWRTATDALLAVMDLSLAPGLVEVGPASPARFPASSPYLGLTGDKEITARVVSRARGPVQRHMSFQTWSFEMECVTSPLEWEDAGS